MSPTTPDLRALRRSIAQLDRSIAQSVRRRLSLARSVGKTKVSRRAPTRDFALEAQVLERWRRALAPSGVTRERAEALARWLIEESVRVQQKDRPRMRGPPTGSSEIAIVGGAGAMGQWLARFFEDGGHRVAVVDPRGPVPGRVNLPDVETAARTARVLVFATPIRSTAPLLRRALATETGALVFDILSVKGPILEDLKAGAAGGRKVTSIHPMFGPSARTLSGRNLLIVSCGVPEADREVRALFAGSAVSMAEVPLDRHDLLMAESLGLAHALNLLFLAALSSDPASPHELAQAASTTFHGQSALARDVAAEGPELYLDIQSLNPHSAVVYRDLHDALDRLQAIVERRDLNAFSELLRDGRAKLSA